MLPLTFPFDVPISGDVTLGFSGSCWASLPGAICGVAVYLDDKHIGDVPHYFNNANQHLTSIPYRSIRSSSLPLAYCWLGS